MTASPSVVGALAMTLASLSYDFADDELAYLALTADGLRMAAVAPESSAYLLALVTHVDGLVPGHLHDVVEQSDLIASATTGAEPVAATARKLWEAEVGRLAWPCTRFAIGAGSRWGLAVELDAYLVGPLPQVVEETGLQVAE